MAAENHIAIKYIAEKAIAIKHSYKTLPFEIMSA
jgi:hypothetical protein